MVAQGATYATLEFISLMINTSFMDIGVNVSLQSAVN